MPERGYWGLIGMSRRVVNVQFWTPKRFSAPKLTLAEPRAEGAKQIARVAWTTRTFPWLVSGEPGIEAPRLSSGPREQRTECSASSLSDLV